MKRFKIVYELWGKFINILDQPASMIPKGPSPEMQQTGLHELDRWSSDFRLRGGDPIACASEWLKREAAAQAGFVTARKQKRK